MDAVYQSIKNLLKALINLLAAFIELFVRLINGLASIIARINFRSGRKKDGQADRTAGSSAKEAGSELVCEIREELKQKITGRDAYIMIRAEAEIFESSKIKKAFAGRKKKLANAVTRILLEEEFKNAFLQEEPGEMAAAEEKEAEGKIQSICELGKEAIG